jgi:hypothetical protein
VSGKSQVEAQTGEIGAQIMQRIAMQRNVSNDWIAGRGRGTLRLNLGAVPCSLASPGNRHLD